MVLSAAGGGGRGGRGAARPTEFRIAMKAGQHLVGVTFVQRNEFRDEETLRPRLRSRGTQIAIASVTVTGPYNSQDSGDTASRRHIFTCRPAAAEAEVVCAKRILS